MESLHGEWNESMGEIKNVGDCLIVIRVEASAGWCKEFGEVLVVPVRMFTK